MSEPVLLPAEHIAIMVARSQLQRGENPEINVTDVLLMSVDRLRFRIEDLRVSVDAALALCDSVASEHDERIRTHAPDCVLYHADCLAAAVRRALADSSEWSGK